MNYSYIIGDDYINLTNQKTGTSVNVYDDNAQFEAFKKLIIAKDYAHAETFMDVKQAVVNFGKTLYDRSMSFAVKIEDGAIKYSLTNDGEWQEFNNAMVPRVVKMATEGFDCTPLINFMRNLLQNPSKQSVDELYLFLEQNGCPITEDGCFIAYKIVKDNYMDVYSGKFNNSVGKIVMMERNKVDDRRTNTCSQGLHFCSKDYLPHYSSSGSKDRCMLVKINPADVVSIPNDYNNAKGRTWRYEVVGELAGNDWKRALEDFTTAPIVGSNAGVYDRLSPITGTMDQVFDAYFKYYGDHAVWVDTGRRATMEHVITKLERYAHVSSCDATDWYNDRFNDRFNIDGDCCDDEDELENLARYVNQSYYAYDSYRKTWVNTHNDSPVSRQEVVYELELTVDELMDIETYFAGS